MQIDSKRIFIDTAPFIYFLEDHPVYSDTIKQFLMQCIERDVRIVTSVVTVEEYLVYPYAKQRMDLVDNFKAFMECLNVDIIDINENIAELAAKLRGKYEGFKGMDALQIAAAMEGQCDTFFTNDKQLMREQEIPCVTLDDLMK